MYVPLHFFKHCTGPSSGLIFTIVQLKYKTSTVCAINITSPHPIYHSTPNHKHEIQQILNIRLTHTPMKVTKMNTEDTTASTPKQSVAEELVNDMPTGFHCGTATEKSTGDIVSWAPHRERT